MPIKRTLRYFDLTMMVVSMVIGIGIFRNASIVAQSAGTPLIFFLAWIVGGIICVIGALTFAEIGSRLPVAGGFYKTFVFCYPRPIAFALIWAYIMLNAGAVAAVAFAGAQYITPLLFPSAANGVATSGIFFGLIALLFILNYSGLKSGSTTQNILSGLKIILILFFCAVLLFAKPAMVSAGPTNEDKSFWLALGVSLIPVFFTCGGYQNTINFGGDVKEPQKNIPRAVIAGISITMILYLTINYAYVSMLGFDQVKKSPLIAADLSRILFGDAGATVTSIAIFISILGICNTVFIGAPRMLYAMADEGIIPKIFMKTNEKNQVQEFSLIFFVLLIIIFFVILQTYENLLNYVEFNDTLVLAAGALCVFVLRGKQKEYKGFKIFLYPWLPLIFILVTLYVTVSVIIHDPGNAGFGFLILLAGVPIYYLLNFAQRNRRIS